jgi:hypothetical protein
VNNTIASPHRVTARMDVPKHQLIVMMMMTARLMFVTPALVLV